VAVDGVLGASAVILGGALTFQGITDPGGAENHKNLALELGLPLLAAGLVLVTSAAIGRRNINECADAVETSFRAEMWILGRPPIDCIAVRAYSDRLADDYPEERALLISNATFARCFD
jgi:hypothetical protein